MSDKNWKNPMNRRKILKTTGAAVGSSLTLGATGTAAAAGSSDGSNQKCGMQEISTEGDLIVTLVEALGEKFLFKEAAAHRNADVSSQSAVTTYEATESGYPLEFHKIDSSITASDINSDGTIQTQGVSSQGIHITPENFVKRYDVVTKRISTSCGDIAFNDHDAIEFYFEGGGAFSTIGIAGLASILCYAAGASAAIPTGGLSGALAAGICGMFTAAVDAAIDVDEIPNNVKMSLALWDYDEDQIINISPSIALGIAPGYGVHWNQMPQVGEYDVDLHLGLPQ
ncbi:hypothetical protein [Haladaptatus sp. T7]|uniref:hypothetical protein n=1 Tax=Haladaptatus sp. T7 TaxID=2029368 RepID=UPI0021A25188|nr:hypothetical protein [Haladaptatus sp. T7]GKZ15786.1 hypothetical protein HAL_36670 [Haladaptatus sp. T7]